MTLDRLWYLAEEASGRAEEAYHRLAESHDDYLEVERDRRVSRDRFRTLAERVARCGAPFGAHTLVYRPSGALLLVRHEEADRWVLPGGGVEDGERFRETAERELREEAGVEATYGGLGYLARMRFRAGGREAWGVMPVYEARAGPVEPTVSDPDGEISAARWFQRLPADTRDREVVLAWRRRRFGE